MTVPGPLHPAHLDPVTPLDRLVRGIEATVRAGELPRAIDMARTGLSRGFEHPLLLNLRAYWFEQQNRQNEAIWDLQRAAALAPKDVLVRNALGLSFTQVEHWTEAIAEFEAAIASQPDFVPAHFNLACARERVGDLEGARLAFEHTRSLDPANMDLVARLAALAARRADWDTAKRLAGEALAGDPNETLAIVTLANVAMQTDDASAEPLIAKILGDPKTSEFYRAMTLSLLGDFRHSQSRYAEAFLAYEEGNALRRKLFAPRFAAPGVQSVVAYAEWLTDQYRDVQTARWSVLAATKHPSSPPKEHIFQIGFPRSGTTLLENVLASNPAIVTLEEKDALVDAVRAFLIRTGAREQLETADETTLDSYRQLYWKRVNEHCEIASRVFIDKQPLTTMKLPIIARLFPKAKILFSVRDPRDVVLSCFRRQFTLNPAMFEFLDVAGAAKFYSAVMGLAVLYRDKFQQPWHEVRYERLVDEFETEARAACTFTGAEWNEEMRDFAERAQQRAIATPSANQVRLGLNRRGIGQWRHYRDQMAPALPILQPWIETFGYPAD